MPLPDIATLSCSPERLTVHWADGARSEFSSLWLRDNLPEDRDRHSGQRLIDIMDVPERSLRMFELGGRLGWEKSRVSKQVSRMAARDLVQRRECPDDRRGAFVDLTDVGLAAIRSAAPAHVELVQRLVFDGLNRAQVRSLATISRVLLNRFDEVVRDSAG